MGPQEVQVGQVWRDYTDDETVQILEVSEGAIKVKLIANPAPSREIQWEIGDTMTWTLRGVGYKDWIRDDACRIRELIKLYEGD